LGGIAAGIVAASIVLTSCPAGAQPPASVARTGPTILFLGDSITAAGHHLDDVETTLCHARVTPLPTILNLGLSSETVTGLSEPDHPFPRPNVHERLTRVLERTRPEIVVACYGMNDGIYHPFSEERFAAFQEGVHRLVRACHDTGARVVLLTPPPFAMHLLKPESERQAPPAYGFRHPDRNYDDVLKRYAEWVLTLNAPPNVRVIDLRTPLLPVMQQAYEKDPVHPNRTGHEVMADALLANWETVVGRPVGVGPLQARRDDPLWRQIREIVAQRRQAYDRTLLWVIGHQRPGTPPELTLEDAEQAARDCDAQLAPLLRTE
jgi:lysophospholipase L1-like esterase